MSEFAAVLRVLKRLYPEPESELNFNSPYQLIVAVALSAQCTDKKVNAVTPTLFAKYPTISKLSRASITAVENIIRPINYYKTKAKNLVLMAKMAESDFSGQIPRTHHELMLLPGVGNKTANVVLNELGAAQTFPVDTHVFRVSQRLGMASGKTPEAIEEQLKARFPSAKWRDLHHWLILHGRRVCKARRPLCAECALSQLCPSSS